MRSLLQEPLYSPFRLDLGVRKSSEYGTVFWLLKMEAILVHKYAGMAKAGVQLPKSTRENKSTDPHFPSDLEAISPCVANHPYHDIK